MSISRLLVSPLIFVSLLSVSLTTIADPPKVVSGGINPLSVVRINDHVNYMISIKFSDGKTAQQWHTIDCKQGKAQQLYWDLLDEEGLIKIRYYGKSYLRYAPAQDDKQMTAEDIHRICQFPVKNAQWEKLSATSPEGMTDLIDINSIQHVGDILSVSWGYDVADISWEPPYDAPLVLKIEHYFYNCKTHSGGAVAAMNVDSDGRVTDSLITADIVRRKNNFPVDTEKSQRFEQLCQLKAGETFHAKGPFVPARNKPVSTMMGPAMPQLDNNNPGWLAKYPLSAEIEYQAQLLIKPWALPRFKQLRYTEVSSQGKINIQLDAQPDGYVRKLEDYGIWKVQRLMLANQLQLKFTMSIDNGASVLHQLQTDLHFPLAVGQRFTARWDNIDDSEKVSATSTSQCEVTQEGAANSLASKFSGKYLLVECKETNGSQPETTSKIAWLKDLNIFVPVTSQVNGKPESQVRLENVSVVR